MSVQFVAASTQTVGMGTGSSAAQNVSGVTLMGWYKPVSLPATQCDIIGLSNGVATGSSRCKIATLSTGAIQGNGRCLDADTNRTFAGTAGKVATGSWQHICGGFDYTNKLIIIYYNGVLDATSAALVWGNAPTSNTASLAMNIGSQHNGGTEYANGIIDDVRVYNRLLSAAEILTIFNCQGTDCIAYGLQHWYHLDEGYPGQTITSAGAVKDMGVLKMNGSGTNSPTWQGSVLSYIGPVSSF